jgi:hypothetical protein
MTPNRRWISSTLVGVTMLSLSIDVPASGGLSPIMLHQRVCRRRIHRGRKTRRGELEIDVPGG